MPSEADVQGAISAAVRILNEGLKYATLNNTGEFFTGDGSTTADVSHEEQFRTALEPSGNGLPFEFEGAAINAVDGYRARLASCFDSAASMIYPLLLDYAKVLGVPDTSTNGILDRLYKHFIDNALRIPSRNFTFDNSPSASPTAVEGVINRITVDENGLDLEACHAETKTLRCIRDAHSGATRHEEVFEIYGEDRDKDSIIIDGSGLRREIVALSARNSQQWIQNPSFSQSSGTPQTTSFVLTGWDVTAPELCSIDTTTTYRDYDGEGTASSLKITSVTGNTACAIDQSFLDRRMQFDPGVPWYLQVAVYKPTTATAGDINVQLGSNTAVTVNFSTLAVGWNVVRSSTGLTAGGNVENWFKEFRSSVSQAITIEVNVDTPGEHILLDDVVISPMQQFDGHWYAIVGGATKFLRDDKFTFTDTATEGSILQRWFVRAFNRMLPHDNGSPTSITWADPT